MGTNSVLIAIKAEPIEINNKCAEIYRNGLLGTYSFRCFSCNETLDSSGEDVFNHLDKHFNFEELVEEYLEEEEANEKADDPEFVEIKFAKESIAAESQADRIINNTTEIEITPPENIESENYKCDICYRNYHRTSNFAAHMKTHENHSEEAKICCSICKIHFERKEDIYLHNITVHNDNKCKLSYFGQSRASNEIIEETMLNEEKESEEYIHIDIGLKEEAEMEIDNCPKSNVPAHIMTVKHPEIHLLKDKTQPNSIEDAEECYKVEIVKAHHVDNDGNLYNALETRFKCEICGISISTWRKLAAHIHNKHANYKLMLKCVHCGKLYSHKQNLKKHYNREHPDEMPLNNNDFNEAHFSLILSKKINGDEDFSKEELEKVDADEQMETDFNAHNKNANWMHNEQQEHLNDIDAEEEEEEEDAVQNENSKGIIIGYKCASCNVIFPTYGIYSGEKHKRTHPDGMPSMFQCALCDKLFSTHPKLKQHVKTDHPNVLLSKGLYKCSICCRTYVKKENYENHVQLSHTNVEYPCDICQKVFKTESTLLVHKQSVHDPNCPKIECDICGNKFKSKAHFKIHYRCHTGEKPYECSECKMRFNYTSQMTHHVMRIHRRDKKHQCELCGQGFYGAYNLAEHMKRHTNTKPMQCSYCDERFYNRRMQIIHERKHTGEKPYVCKECGEAFRTTNRFSEHRMMHKDNGIKRYGCRFCDMKFATTLGQKSHERIKHAIE